MIRIWRNSLNRLKAGFLTFALLASGAIGGNQVFAAAPLLQVFPIYDSWSGSDSHYAGSPPCFLLRSLPEYEIFWRLHGLQEIMPHVNFEKTMLFVWCPGPGRFDYRPMRIERFFRDANGQMVLLMGLDRQKTGGNMRNYFLIALLPRLSGSIAVMRVGDKASGEAPRMPLFNIWDLSGDVPTPVPAITVVKAPPKKKVEGSGTGSGEATTAGAGRTNSAMTAAGKQAAEDPIKPTAMNGTTGNSGSFPASGTPTDTATSGTASNASDDADPFKDAFNLDL
ncbi:MAG: hypothetical protein WA705_17385 [Candidatus Ozemobacteraceae bacterium]